MLNGRQMLNSPVRLPISTWNGVLTTTCRSEGGDVGKFHLSERTYPLQRVIWPSTRRCMTPRQLQHAVNDALFGVKFTTFYFGRGAVAAEQVIHLHVNTRLGEKHHQTYCRAAVSDDQVKVGWHRQVAGKLMIRLNVRIAPTVISGLRRGRLKQPHTELTCKTFRP